MATQAHRNFVDPETTNTMGKVNPQDRDDANFAAGILRGTPGPGEMIPERLLSG